MTGIDQLVQELEGKFYDVPAYDIRQILKYLHSHGYLGASSEGRIVDEITSINQRRTV